MLPYVVLKRMQNQLSWIFDGDLGEHVIRASRMK